MRNDSAAGRGLYPRKTGGVVSLQKPLQFLSGDRKYAIVAAVDFSQFSRDLFLADELIDYADTQGTTLYVLNQDISLNQWKRERDQRLYALLKGGAAQ